MGVKHRAFINMEKYFDENALFFVCINNAVYLKNAKFYGEELFKENIV